MHLERRILQQSRLGALLHIVFEKPSTHTFESPTCRSDPIGTAIPQSIDKSRGMTTIAI
jgi:hypothetical protein